MQLLTPEDQGFESALSALSATGNSPAAIPAAIARPRTADEVVAAVDLARTRGLTITVRSGGHSLSGTHLRPGAMVLDLRAMCGLVVDPDSGSAIAGPGLTSAAAVAGLERRGFSFPVGHVGTVGLGGFLLAGGNGWQIGGREPACAKVSAVQVVTGRGEIRWADADRSPELFRAARGAGPAFPGVVTSFRLDLVPGVPTVHRITATVPIGAARDLGAVLDDLSAGNLEITVFARPDELTVTATAFTFDGQAPPSDFTRLHRLDLPTIGTPEVRVTSSLGELLSTLPDHSADAQSSHHVWARRSWSQLLEQLPSRAGPSPQSSLLISPAPRDSGSQPMMYRPPKSLGVSAYAHAHPDRTADLQWSRVVIAELERSWEPAAEPNDSAGWARRYIGEVDCSGGADRIQQSLLQSDLHRLRELRQEIDPEAVVATVFDN